MQWERGKQWGGGGSMKQRASSSKRIDEIDLLARLTKENQNVSGMKQEDWRGNKGLLWTTVYTWLCQLDEINLLYKHKWPQLTQSETDRSNSSVALKETEFIIPNSHKRNLQAQLVSLESSTEYLKKSEYQLCTRKGNKRHIDQKRTVPLCRYHDCVYRRSQGICQKLLELANEFIKVTRYKIYTQNQPHFLTLARNTWTSKLKIQYHLKSFKR